MSKYAKLDFLFLFLERVLLKMDDYSHAPYYEDQTEWGCDDYYQLNRYLNRLFGFAARRMNEIDAMDVTKMSEETKVLIYVQIQFKNLTSLLEKENLSSLKDTQPLKKRLNLVENPKGVHEIYSKFNIGW